MATGRQRPQIDSNSTLPPHITPEYVEILLSDFITRDEDCKGRIRWISPDPMRGPFERDGQRILYSDAFKRLKRKTQVFYEPENDHICTRLDHTLQVASIAETICIELGLNIDLARAIAYGHDLGHAPFGHTGEEALNELRIEKDLGTFMHEANSLRVVDKMAELHGDTLNLTYEVRDGIVCHCGEQFDQVLIPQRQKDVTLVSTSSARVEKPYTLEGCVVRYADRIAYLAADLKDALELRIIRKKDVPSSVRMHLGVDTGKIIDKVTKDIIRESMGNDYITTSEKIFDSLNELYRFSAERIYHSDFITRRKEKAKSKIKELFDEFLQALNNTERAKNKALKKRYTSRCHQEFFKFLKMTKYDDSESPEQIVLDYISGMTDNFVNHCYNDIFQIRTPIRLNYVP
jgi:dGTPase